MYITDIRHTKRGRFSIYVDDEFYCVLHADIFATCSLSVGREASQDYLDELRIASEQRITRERALRLLGGRSYTEQGLYRKLCEHTDEECAVAAVARMVELGLLDDADYARRFVADCINLKGFSHRRCAQELARKGIARDIIESTLDALEEDAQPAIARIVKRKYMRYIADEKGYTRTVNALVRLGYSYGDIRTVLQNLLEDEDYYEEFL